MRGTKKARNGPSNDTLVHTDTVAGSPSNSHSGTTIKGKRMGRL